MNVLSNLYDKFLYWKYYIYFQHKLKLKFKTQHQHDIFLKVFLSINKLSKDCLMTLKTHKLAIEVSSSGSDLYTRYIFTCENCNMRMSFYKYDIENVFKMMLNCNEQTIKNILE